MMIKNISFISLLCVSIGLASAENENRRPELNQKSSEASEKSMPNNQTPKTEIKSTQKARKRKNDDTFIHSEQISEDIGSSLDIFPVNI
jgi:hypothetical protein